MFFKKKIKDLSQLPEIDEISTLLPAVSKYLDAFRLPDAFKETDSDTLPVINEKGEIIGIVSEYDLAKVVTDWSLSEDSYMYKIKVNDIMTKNVWTETSHTNIEELLSAVPKMHTRVIPIVDENKKYIGYSITRTAVINFLSSMIKPRTIGGLATPLGVYLTDGLHQAGSKTPGLLLNGFVFAFVILFIKILSGYLIAFIPLPDILFSMVQLFMFLVILRFTLFSKIHAAEHKTINAIEKGLPLNLETVKMQPRVHIRCGTNYIVFIFGVILIISIANSLIPDSSILFRYLFILFGFIFVMSYWRNMGRWLQKYFTTSEPTDKQIENGIKAGEELLLLHKQDIKNVYPTFFSKLWNMGIFQIIFAFLLTSRIIEYMLLNYIK